MIDIPMMPLPHFEIPKEMDSVFEGIELNKKTNITANYEVIERDESGVRIKLNSIYLKGKQKRS